LRWCVTKFHYYIYVHRRPNTGEVFYVGKGSWSSKKAYGRSKSLENRNPIWNRIVAKCGGKFDSEVVACFFEESDAFKLEVDLIAWYGRKNIGTGCLSNLTDGGEGAVGRAFSDASLQKRKATIAAMPKVKRTSSLRGRRISDEHREAIRASALKGEKNPMFGKVHPPEIREKMSAKAMANRPSAKKVIDDATGVIYGSAREAARMLGINPSTLKSRLVGYVSNRTTLRYA
jgi:hypothetical protein